MKGPYELLLMVPRSPVALVRTTIAGFRRLTGYFVGEEKSGLAAESLATENLATEISPVAGAHSLSPSTDAVDADRDDGEGVPVFITHRPMQRLSDEYRAYSPESIGRQWLARATGTASIDDRETDPYEGSFDENDIERLGVSEASFHASESPEFLPDQQYDEDEGDSDLGYRSDAMTSQRFDADGFGSKRS